MRHAINVLTNMTTAISPRFGASKKESPLAGGLFCFAARLESLLRQITFAFNEEDSCMPGHLDWLKFHVYDSVVFFLCDGNRLTSVTKAR
jgi:hypothetical protein